MPTWCLRSDIECRNWMKLRSGQSTALMLVGWNCPQLSGSLTKLFPKTCERTDLHWKNAECTANDELMNYIIWCKKSSSIHFAIQECLGSFETKSESNGGNLASWKRRNCDRPCHVVLRFGDGRWVSAELCGSCAAVDVAVPWNSEMKKTRCRGSLLWKWNENDMSLEMRKNRFGKSNFASNGYSHSQEP